MPCLVCIGIPTMTGLLSFPHDSSPHLVSSISSLSQKLSFYIFCRFVWRFGLTIIDVLKGHENCLGRCSFLPLIYVSFYISLFCQCASFLNVKHLSLTKRLQLISIIKVAILLCFVFSEGINSAVDNTIDRLVEEYKQQVRLHNGRWRSIEW